MPESQPPTNIHVLIGRNGVGKTHLLNHMTRALVEAGANVTDVAPSQPRPTRLTRIACMSEAYRNNLNC